MENENKPKFDMDAVRKKLSGLTGSKLWRSIEQIAETDDFKEFLRHEYPHGANLIDSPISRRNFLKLMGASFLLASFPGCSKQPVEKIVANVKAREKIVPGKPLYFATSMPWRGAACGLLVESHMGRPTKIEGNPEHPDSLGATNLFHQASVLGLYDPDRSKLMMADGALSTWTSFANEMKKRLADFESTEGAGFRILTETVTSPTLKAQLDKILEKYPNAKWHQYEPASKHLARVAEEIAFGSYTDSYYDFTKADAVLSFGSDFLISLPGSVRYARDFMSRRNLKAGANQMNRLYVVESTPTLTGAKADHLQAVSSYRMVLFARVLAKKLGVSLDDRGAESLLNDQERHWISVAASDLGKMKGRSLVLAGVEAPVEVQVLVHAVNEVLNNRGNAVRYLEPVEAKPVNQVFSLAELVQDLNKGIVELLVVLDGDPVFNAPSDFAFLEQYKKAKRRVHFGLYENETAVHSHWHIPAAHYLEIFSDSRASDGSLSLLQPLIEPLYGGRSIHEVVALFTGEAGKSGHEIVQDFWKSQWNGGDFEKHWRRVLHDGVLKDSASPEKNLSAKTNLSGTAFPEEKEVSLESGNLELIFRADPTIDDGRFINNGWLQETPKPFTKLTWDNTLLVAPKTAERFGFENEDLVEITLDGKSARVPVWVVPGHAEETATVYFGYGQQNAGKVGRKTGVNVFSLRSFKNMYAAAGARLEKTGLKNPLASTQLHNSMQGRDIVRAATLAQYQHNPEFAQHEEHGDPSLLSFYPPHAYEGNKWGMTVDLTACIGCNACVTGCQSENNVPIVGKEEVMRGREMHWIRVDNYYEGELDHPDVHHQPVMCMHCENAPCEPVCPVGATVHSPEGLNEMVYNRCVGTRYCSNNCPYKVRRFNFFEYGKTEDYNILQLMRNPDVTVRNRGVMEKCTFCVQRINQARITSQKENRAIKDGEIVTACQQVCPTKAIQFGNLNDPQAEVVKYKQHPLNYGLLTELNTNPRLSYLAEVKNPHPDLVKHGLLGETTSHH